MAPHPSPTASYWNKTPIPLCSPPRPPNSFRERPPIVIIGSGITAVSIAYSLLSLMPTAHLVVLDARSVCDGATGRNGGHCKVVPHEELAKLTRRFGAERAVELVRFQLRHLESLKEVCELVDRENGKDKTEFRELETVDLYIDADLFAEAKANVEVMKKAMPDVAVEVWEAESAKKHFGINSDECHGAISYKAGALYPYRLVISLWSHLLKKYPSRLTVKSKTVVTSIIYDIKGPFMVQTTKGPFSAEHVIYATNAYASQFIPPLKDRIVPARMYMIAQRPGARIQKFAGGRSWSVMYRGGFDYATQRPGANGSGDLLIGGGWNRSAARGRDAINNSNDDRVDGMVIRYLEAVFPTLFEEQKLGAMEGTLADMAWSGIISLTPDGLPFVGRLGTRGVIPESPPGEDRGPGEWISAGYCGEGMVFAFLCGAALAAHIAGRENEDLPPRPGVPGGKVSEWFPRELYVTKERTKSTVAEVMEKRGLFD